jgi:hypothetical protein
MISQGEYCRRNDGNQLTKQPTNQILGVLDYLA